MCFCIRVVRESGPRRRPRWPVIAVAAALAVGALGGGAWALGAFSTSCGGSDLRVRIAAQPELVPALRDAAARFNVESREVGGHCVRADIAAVTPADYVRKPAARRGADAWIPESSLWLAVARTSGLTGLPQIAPSLVVSPVVLATTRPVEAELKDAGVEPTWKLLNERKADGIALNRRTTAPGVGMTGAIALIALDQVDRPAAGTVRDLRRAAPDEVSVGGAAAPLADLAELERFDRPLAVTSEQAVVAYNDAHRPNPVVALAPREGTLTLDHPFVVTAADQLRRDAAGAFFSALGSRSAREGLQRFGFRAPDGTLAEQYARRNGIPEAMPRLLRWPTPKDVDQAVKSWG
jgi:hypothetical protein